MNMKFLWHVLLALNIMPVLGQTLAFPGAEGYGKYVTGGRGGQVIEVTNLQDADRYGNTIPNSLRAAFETEGDDPITIVFRVSGTIEMTESEVKVGRSNITVAGQTAPGEGICIKNGYFKFSGNNIIIRYVRFRPGDNLKRQVSCLNIENAENLMIDHCSMSWSIEENLGFYDNINSTIQWCIFSESLYDSYHSKGPRGYGMQLGGQYTSFHHNLLAHHSSRSPRINGSRSNDRYAWVDFRNNIIFNWGRTSSIYGGEEEIPGGECKTNFVNNYYKPGPGTPSKVFAVPSYVTDGNTAAGYAQWVFDGNYMEGVEGGMNDDNWLGVSGADVGGIENIRHDTIFEMSPVTTYTAHEAFDSVLKYAGATLPVRDEVDERIVGETKGEIEVQGSGIIDSQTEVGGWPEYVNNEPPADTDKDGMPDEWELANGLDPNDPEDGKVIAEDGYSNLEHYLNSITGIIGTPIVGIEEKKTSEPARIFPNPAVNEINIEANDFLMKADLIDLAGIVRMEKIESSNSMNININDLEPGMYFVRLHFVDGRKEISPVEIK